MLSAFRQFADRTVSSSSSTGRDKISVREKARKQDRVASALQIAGQVGFPEWVEVDDKKMEGLFKAVPERDEILPDINENLVVELYSK